ncbi:MAG: sulfite exporter TauE/SafE family protein [Beijerinckiaceae bacterium]|jgi:uncharacterized protein|nr:sulfite exporter TauE/SafE family protein [Beijerinckiaceae bacterium]MDO9443257.1 sulfite exporter TauE/SafE family protein [Beijerinckiaceae bacterium]
MFDGANLAAIGDVLLRPGTWFLIVVVAIAGVVRGFSGFGGALIFIPLASAVLGPRFAVPVFYLVDLCTALPYGLRSIRRASMPEIMPMLVGSWIGTPFGAWILSNTDPLALRWGTNVLVLAMLGLLASGWRYSNEPKASVSFTVGITGGVLGAAAGVSGPVIIAYWLGSRSPAATIRANIMVYYALAALGTDAVFYLRGMFGLETLIYAAVAVPIYGLGLVFGARVFKGSTDRQYRIAAFVLIAVSAVVSLPIF